MSRTLPASGPALGGAPRGDPLLPALTVVTLQYHTVPPEKLVAKTISGLVNAGIPSAALGRVTGLRHVTITGCILLNSMAREHLPPQLGGAAASFEGSAATLDLVDRSYQNSPMASRRPSPFSTPRKGGTDGPDGGAAEAAVDSPTATERARLFLALATELTASERAQAQATAARATANRATSELTGIRLRSSARQRGEAPSGGDGSEGAAPVEEHDDAPRLAAAMTAASAAAAASAQAGVVVEEAALRVAELESAVSALSIGSPAPSRAPSGSSTRGVDMAREQQHLVASAQTVGLTSDAIAILSSFPLRFPLIYKSLLKACGGEAPAVLSDFSLLALVPAVQAARQQEWGLDMMRAAVTRGASLAGDDGTEAVQAFADHTFDLNASRALRDGTVSIEVSPLDVCLGVLPLAQLALHLWLHYHSFTPVDSTVLLDLARTVSFASGGRLDPTVGLASFMPVWAQTLGAELDIPHADVHSHLLRALGRDALLPGGGHITITLRGTPITWTAFAFDQAMAWEAARTTRHVHTIDELETFVDHLRMFGQACGRSYRAAANIRSPTDGGPSPSCKRAAVSRPLPEPTAAVPPALIALTPPGPGSTRKAPRPPRGGYGKGRGKGKGGPAAEALEMAPATASPSAPRPAAASPFPLRVPVQVMTTPTNILSTTPLTEAGWSITLRGHAGGSDITCPGVARPFPLRRDATGNIFLDLVADGAAAYTVFDATNREHCLRRPIPFLLDTGAEVTIMGPQSLSMLRDRGSVPAVMVHSFAGASVAALDTGILLINPPSGATIPAGPGTIMEGVVYEGVRCMRILQGGGAPLRLAVASGPQAAAADAVVRTTRQVRASAFPPTRHPHVLAERFNCPTGAAVIALVDANPLGTAPKLCEGLDPARVFDQPYAMGTLKAPPIHATRCTISMAIRDASPPGHVWWTDNSNSHPPDFQGNTCSRIFADERTSAAATFYAARKDSATFIQHLEEMKVWIAQHVPGGRLSVVRCDFASEAVRQGHGDAIMTTALAAWLTANPGTRLIPVPPHSQALNRAENTWGRVHGHSFLCARRARLGPSGWSIVERGAVYIHNHTPATYAVDPAAHRCTRFEALTLRPHDISTMLGFVGQMGWTHREGGKANAQRVSADPVLYVCPATSLHAQIVLNLRSFTLMVVASLRLSVDPYACALVIAGSALHRPEGIAGAPPMEAYEARLNELLGPGQRPPCGDGPSRPDRRAAPRHRGAHAVPRGRREPPHALRLGNPG